MKCLQHYFKEISNIKFPHLPILEGIPNAGPVPHITTKEIAKAIDSMICQRILSQRMLKELLVKSLRDIAQLITYQCGFIKGCSTSDAIFAVRMLMKNHCKKKKLLHIVFLELEKTFDQVPHQLIWYALWDHEVPEKLINWVQMLYENTSSYVRCAAVYTKAQHCRHHSRPATGCPMGPALCRQHYAGQV